MKKPPKESKPSAKVQESHEEPGEQWGPYELGEQVEPFPPSQAELYLARHQESGALALVLKAPEQGQGERPQGDWQVRYSGSGSTGYLALEVERSPWLRHPGQPSADELLCVFEDLRAGVEHMAQALLNLAPPRSPMPRLGLALVGGAAVGALLLALLLRVPEAQPRGGSGPEVAATQQALRAQGLAAVAGPETFAGRGLESATPPGLPGLTRPLPGQPFKGKMRPPCTRGFTELIGACWIEAKVTAPCPDDLYEHQGKCYLPVMNAQPPPQAIGQ